MAEGVVTQKQYTPAKQQESIIPPLSYEVLFHTILTPLTAKDGLGINRVMVFSRNRDPAYLDGTYGVGPLNGGEVKEAWDGSPATLSESVFELPPSSYKLNEAIRNTQIKIEEHPTLESAVNSKGIRTSPGNDSLNYLFMSHGIDIPGAYAVAPILTQGPIANRPEVLGVLFGDNTYNPESHNYVQNLKLAAFELSAAIRAAQSYKQIQQILGLIQGEKGLERQEADRIAYELCMHFSHLIRNPAVILGGYARSLKEELDKGKGGRQPDSSLAISLLEKIVEVTSRLEELPDNLPTKMMEELNRRDK